MRKAITIGFESGPLYRPMTGVANYTFNMVRASLEADDELHLVGFGDFSAQLVDLAVLSEIDATKYTADRRSANLSQSIGRRLTSRVIKGLSTNHTTRLMYRALRQKQFSWSASRQALDLFHAYNFRPPADPGVPILPVVYDLSTFRYPEFHPLERVRWLDGLADTLISAPLVQTISEFSKREIVDLFNYPPERIFVAPPAAAPLFSPAGEVITQPDLDVFDLCYGQFILAVGTLEPRKNLRTLVAGYTQLTPSQRARCPLVIVGGAGWGELKLPAAAEAMIAEGTLRFLSGVSNRSLRSLYEGARLLAMPSLYEGFGMPVVEALACGTAVVHSADTAMDEVSGDLGVRVSALDPDGWATALRNAVEEDGHAAPVLRARRTSRAGRFDWRKSAGAIIEAYGRIINAKG